MGKVIETLIQDSIPEKAIFNNRFVIEVCERFHIHYRNLRIALSTVDFKELTKGCAQALERWHTLGCPENPKEHIELCRKQIARDTLNDGIRVNLNENLYNKYDGRIFSEGSEFKDERYIHLKIRDMRIEMSIPEFKEFADAIAKASERLASSDTRAML